jgi:toxin ParE1/3/4
MKLRLRITGPARDDLSEIRLFVAQASESAANRLVVELFSRFDLLCSTPEAGRQCPEIARDSRCFPYRRYMIYYRLIPGEVHILRVLHGSRDVTALTF